MSHRKTRKEKIKSQERRKAYFEELDRLNAQKKELEERIELEKAAKAKGFHIRNLNVFKDTCNALIPYVVCAGISVGGFLLLQGGLPFHRDNINLAHYSVLTMEDQGKNPILETEYRRYGWAYQLTTEGEITIYTPWEEKDGSYTRYKRTYSISENQQEIIASVLKKDYKKLFEELGDYKEEIETTNHIHEGEDDYTIEGKIYYLHNKDRLTIPEDVAKNVIITFIELLVTFGLGYTFAYNRDFEYTYAINEDLREYRAKVRVLKNDLEKLEETNNKVLTLTRRGRI